LHGLKARASVLGIAQPMTGQPHVTRAGPRCSPIGIDRIQEREPAERPCPGLDRLRASV
jgi:hypothetical protein